jgi:hypothetical protein
MRLQPRWFCRKVDSLSDTNREHEHGTDPHSSFSMMYLIRNGHT